MRPLRLILAAAAAAYVVSQYWQERRRLMQLQKLDVRTAMARHERTRTRAQRTLTMIAGIICLAAAGLAVYAFAILPPPGGR